MTAQPEPSTHDDVPTEMHGGETGFAAGGGETGYGTPVSEEPHYVSSEEPSFEAGHAGATEDAGGDTGHPGGADAPQEMHHS